MKLDKKEGTKRLTDVTGEVVLIGDSISSNFVLIDKHGYEQCYVQHERIRISKKRLKDDFEIVDNFKIIDFLKKEGKLKPSYFLYRHRMFDCFVTVVRDGFFDDEDSPEKLEDIGDGFKKVASIYYKSGCEDLDLISEALNEVFDTNYDSSSKVNLVLKTASGFTFKEVSIKPMSIDIDLMYNDDFKETYQQLVNQLENGTKGLALLHGGAGTGKSNLIRHLTKEIPSKRFVFIPATMISSLSDPMFLSTLIDNKGAILVLEDCENYIKDRKVDSVNSVVSGILNMTDGILSDVLGVQLICTFNSSIQDIDKALLRRGRLICNYEFKPLEKSKALNLLKTLGVENDDSGQTIPTTLADIYNTAPPSNITTIKRIGFGN